MLCRKPMALAMGCEYFRSFFFVYHSFEISTMNIIFVTNIQKMISYRYNIYNQKNNKWLDQLLAECCFVWNHALALQRRYYKIFGKYIKSSRMEKHFAKRIKRTLLHSQTTQEILQRLDSSYQKFFKRLAKRPPKFKSNKNFKSFVFKQGGFTLNGNVLTINKINKHFKFSYSRNYEGNIKQIRIKRSRTSRYSLIVVTDKNPSQTKEKTHNGASAGIDFGLKTYLTLSNGKEYQSPLFFKQSQNKIKAANKKLSRAKKGSSNRKRRRLELARVHEKVFNQREDYQWKLAQELCKSFDCIFIEDLNIEAMKRLWGKKISDLSHALFIKKLEHTALKYGVVLHKINKWYPSSKTCSCGFVNKNLSLKERTWNCPKCGSVNERDLLAAQNIFRKGISELASKSKTSVSEASCA